MFLCLTALYREWGDLSTRSHWNENMHSLYELWHSDHTLTTLPVNYGKVDHDEMSDMERREALMSNNWLSNSFSIVKDKEVGFKQNTGTQLLHYHDPHLQLFHTIPSICCCLYLVFGSQTFALSSLFVWSLAVPLRWRKLPMIHIWVLKSWFLPVVHSMLLSTR